MPPKLRPKNRITKAQAIEQAREFQKQSKALSLMRGRARLQLEVLEADYERLKDSPCFYADAQARKLKALKEKLKTLNGKCYREVLLETRRFKTNANKLIAKLGKPKTDWPKRCELIGWVKDGVKRHNGQLCNQLERLGDLLTEVCHDYHKASTLYRDRFSGRAPGAFTRFFEKAVKVKSGSEAALTNSEQFRPG